MTKEASINSKEPTLHKLQSDQNAVKLGLDNKRIVFKNPICLETKKHTTNNSGERGNHRENYEVLKTKQNESTICQNMWDTISLREIYSFKYIYHKARKNKNK